MRKIAVYTSFMKDSYRRQINAVAAEHGFEVHYFENAADFTARIGEFEVIYSHPTPAMLQQARSLKWLHSDFAGIEKYLPDEVWPHPGCILSNSSGAYGPTISEHVVMVLLMLLHRMPEYQRDIAMKQWTYLVPSRSIIGSKFVMLGTGDIGSNVARRLKALGGSVTGVCRTGKSDESAFDRVVTVSELDSVLPEADAVILALPATAGTVNILSRERIPDERGRLCGERGSRHRHRPGGSGGGAAGQEDRRRRPGRDGSRAPARRSPPVRLPQHHHHPPHVRQHGPGPDLRHRCGYVLPGS